MSMRFPPWLPPPRLPGLLLALLLLGACQAGFFGAVNLARDGGEHLSESVRFDAEHGLALDVYRPASAGADTPVVVFFYGGSWRNGERAWYRFVGDHLASLGAVVVIPDYRTYPTAAFPAFMHDAAAAVAWVQAHRDQLGAGGGLLLAGHSAGAHIAALLATDPGYLAAHGIDSADIDGVVGLAGPYDFLPIESRKLRQVFVDEAGARAAQPVAHVGPHSPPFLLIHGLDDDLVWPRNSESLAARLRAAGRPVQLELIDDVGHIELLFALGREHALGRRLDQLLGAFMRAPGGAALARRPQ